MRRRALLTALAATAVAPASAQTLVERLTGTALDANSFVQLVTIGDNFEIQSSRILLERSTHPTIRDFAQRMIDDHTMLSAELRSLPEATTRQSAQFDERHADMLEVLRRQPDADMLDRWYVQQQIQAHEETVRIYETYAANGDVPALRSFAQRHAPMIAQHLAQARALQAPRSP
jgi:putative membrane protein